MKSGISNKPPNGEVLQQIYEARFEGRLEYRNTVWQVLVKEYFQQWVNQNDVVLDLGAGYGEFINNIVCREKYAMDLNPDTALRSRTDVDVLQQDCSEQWPLADNSLDVVFTSNFFEHLPNTPALSRTLREAKRCLKPGGRLIALGPNIKYACGAYWDFIDHHLPLTELSLSEACTQQGFRIETCIARFLPFTMASGPHYPSFFVSLYVHLPFVWRMFGKQFLVIAKKI